jgi:putative copper resistance protein D
MIAFLAAARAIHFGSLMTIFGGSAYGALLRRAGLGGPPRKSVRVLFVIAASLAFVSGIVWLCLIAGQMSGDWRGSLDPSILRLAATGTRFGRIFLARLAGLAALWVLCVLGIRSEAAAVPVVSGLLLASLAPVSHAAAMGSDVAIVGAANDAVHLLTAGFWVGGLLILAMLIPRHWAEPAALLGPLRIFSIWGSFVVALLVLTGLINAASILPIAALSPRNPYFDLLVAKVGLASVMIGLAALNRWRFAPALRGCGEKARQHLAVSVGGEIVLGFTVIAIAGLLGLTAPH